jgi:hypothetical protein
MRPDYEHMLLTKRPAHVASLMLSIGGGDGWAVTSRMIDRLFKDKGITKLPADFKAPGWPIPNVRWGTSIESPRVLERASQLRAIPAAGRFISFEPLLASVDVSRILKPGEVQLFIVGGESGRRARPLCLHAARHLLAQARELGAAFFMKQLGGVVSMTFDEWNEHTDGGTNGSMKFTLGADDEQPGRWKPHDRSGGDMAEFPADLQVREWPAPLGVLA